MSAVEGNPTVEKLLSETEQSPLRTTQQAKELVQDALAWEQVSLARDNRDLRKRIAAWVGAGLGAEILFLFWLVASQGTGMAVGFGEADGTPTRFVLEQWTFNVFTTSVLVQTFALATLIVRNLFPENHNLDAADMTSKLSGK